MKYRRRVQAAYWRAVIIGAVVLCAMLAAVIIFVPFGGGSGQIEDEEEFEEGSFMPVEHVDEPKDVFDRFMKADFPPADGFDFPVGDPDARGGYTDIGAGEKHPGWYIAVDFCQYYMYGLHPAEDWNGMGGSNTDLGQPVRASATGKVVFSGISGSSGGVVMLQHVYYENHRKKRIRSVYKHLDDIRVKKGDIVYRRQTVGLIGQNPDRKMLAHLHLEFRHQENTGPGFWPSRYGKTKEWVQEHYEKPSSFIRAHRYLLVPQQERRLMLVDQGSGRVRLYEKGRLLTEQKLGLSQPKADGGRLPKGMYFVVKDKNRVKKAGGGSDANQPRCLQFNFPNKFDALWGLEQKLIPGEIVAQITRAWQDRRSTHENTPWTLAQGQLLLKDGTQLSPLCKKIRAGAMLVIF